MSTRSFGDFTLFSGVLDNVSSTNIPALGRFATFVLNPQAKVIEADCGTQLGSVEPFDDSLIGQLELLTDTIIDETRLNTLKASGKTTVSIRTLPTCISSGGVCQKCYEASEGSTPDIGSVIRLVPADSSAFYTYLAESYSGSVVGVEALPSGPLPLRRGLLSEMLSPTYIDFAFNHLRDGCDKLPADLLAYCESISDRLEKSLFIIFLYGIYCT